MKYKELDTCYNCGRLYNNSINILFCPDCAPKMSKKIDLMNEYLSNNPDTLAEDLSKMFGVKKEVIRSLRKKKFLFTGCCRFCGDTIFKGVMCDECKKQQLADLSSISFEKPTLEDTKAVMRFLGTRIR